MPSDDLDQVLAVIADLARKAAGGDYIFRGEPQCYPEVSSSLYRELEDTSTGQVEAVQKVRLSEARRFTTEPDEFEILTELQHYGGKTNLIDFTADYLIALFFACDGSHSQKGRVLLLDRVGRYENYIREPNRPVNRVIAQKSVFVRPPEGFIKPDLRVVIPAPLKAPLLRHLRRCHGIAAETIYNDLHGYIRYAAIHQEASAIFSAGQARLNTEDYRGAIADYTQALARNPQLVEAYNARGVAHGRLDEVETAITDFTQAIALDPDYAVGYSNRGLAYGVKGETDLAIQDFTTAINSDPDYAMGYFGRGLSYWVKDERDLAIQDFTSAINLNPDFSEAYCNRGEAWLHLSQWEKARADLVSARDLGYDIVASFRHDYENVAAFEQQHGVQLPPDIAEMLGG